MHTQGNGVSTRSPTWTTPISGHGQQFDLVITGEANVKHTHTHLELKESHPKDIDFVLTMSSCHTFVSYDHGEYEALYTYVLLYPKGSFSSFIIKGFLANTHTYSHTHTL